MKTFYSILSAIINPVSGEKISIGLLLSDGNKSIFDFSENRLSLVNSLLDKDTKKFVRQYLSSIENVIENIDVNHEQTTIFDKSGKNLIMNEPYIAYLSIYNQNVVSFSKPDSIDLQVNRIVFDSLFSKFIGSETHIRQGSKNIIQLRKDNFYPKVKEFYSIEKTLLPAKFKKLMLPVSVDLFGLNEHYVTGQFFELEKKINFIKSDFYDFNQVNLVTNPVQKFIISSEPEKSHLC